jgi:hypothetical protein
MRVIHCDERLTMGVSIDTLIENVCFSSTIQGLDVCSIWLIATKTFDSYCFEQRSLIAC